MEIEKFEDIIAWQKAKERTLDAYSLTKAYKDFGFIDQICREAISIMNNFVEVIERKSDSECKHFLFVAQGSCAEERLMLCLAEKLDYFSDKKNILRFLTNQSKY